MFVQSWLSIVFQLQVIYFFICMGVIYILILRGQGLAIAGRSHNYTILLQKTFFSIDIN